MEKQPYRLVHEDKPEITLVSLSEEGLKLLLGAPDLLEAAEDFVAKVDRGDARSVDSYAKFSAAIAKATE